MLLYFRALWFERKLLTSMPLDMTATALLGIAGTILPWHPTFNGQNMAWLRVGFFIGLGATGFMPVFQIILTRGSAWAYEFYLDSNLVKSLLVYVLGACVYASKVPERWFPGAFDFFGNAHNLWHVGDTRVFQHSVA